MSKATLTIPTPKSCTECDLTHYCFVVNQKDTKGSIFMHYALSRHPNCPLVIEVEGLQWKLKGDSIIGTLYDFQCPKCLAVQPEYFTDYCPSCGVKLDPPLEGDDE
jgi:hypothetical protein